MDGFRKDTRHYGQDRKQREQDGRKEGNAAKPGNLTLMDLAGVLYVIKMDLAQLVGMLEAEIPPLSPEDTAILDKVKENCLILLQTYQNYAKMIDGEKTVSHLISL